MDQSHPVRLTLICVAFGRTFGAIIIAGCTALLVGYCTVLVVAGLILQAVVSSYTATIDVSIVDSPIEARKKIARRKFVFGGIAESRQIDGDFCESNAGGRGAFCERYAGKRGEDEQKPPEL